MSGGSPLLSGLRAQAAARQAPAAQTSEFGDPFAELPEMVEIGVQLDTLAALGLSLPFYRLNEGADAARAVVGGHELVSFASYDYLGLNAHPAVQAAAQAAVARWGISAGASRLVGGERPHHRRLEAALARFQGTEDCLTFVSGHATNVTAIAALVGPDDLIITDALVHNSVAVGAQLSGARRLTMPHGDTDWLDRELTRQRGRARRVLIAVEGLYSMDGDVPDLARLVDIKQRHQAWLMVDEAHALGVLGETGRGSAQHCGVDPRAVEVWMGTLSKTLAGCGGYICGSRSLITLLKARASGFVYSVAMAAPVTAAAEAALEVLAQAPHRVTRLQANSRRFLRGAQAAGLETGRAAGAAVIPVMTGDSLTALRLSAGLFARGIFALPVVHPAVPERAARVRFFVTSEHTAAEIDRAVSETRAVLAAL